MSDILYRKVKKGLFVSNPCCDDPRFVLYFMQIIRWTMSHFNDRVGEASDGQEGVYLD
jgi:hypothetical protein